MVMYFSMIGIVLYLLYLHSTTVLINSTIQSSRNFAPSITFLWENKVCGLQEIFWRGAMQRYISETVEHLLYSYKRASSINKAFLLFVERLVEGYAGAWEGSSSTQRLAIDEKMPPRPYSAAVRGNQTRCGAERFHRVLSAKFQWLWKLNLLHRRLTIEELVRVHL